MTDIRGEPGGGGNSECGAAASDDFRVLRPGVRVADADADGTGAGLARRVPPCSPRRCVSCLSAAASRRSCVHIILSLRPLSLACVNHGLLSACALHLSLPVVLAPRRWRPVHSLLTLCFDCPSRPVPAISAPGGGPPHLPFLLSQNFGFAFLARRLPEKH